MLGWVRDTRLGGAAALVAAIAGCAAFAPGAGASDYRLDGRFLTSRGDANSFENGYWGPEFRVSSWGSSLDYYYCPSGLGLSNWIVVGDEIYSNQWAIDATSNADQADSFFPIRVTNWGLSTVYLRAALACTNNSTSYPYVDPQYGAGDYQAYWDKEFKLHRRPNSASYKGLILRAFCWDAKTPGCPVSTGERSSVARIASVRARKGGNRFALRNGTNRLALDFKHPTGKGPPALYLTGARGCASRRVQTAVHNGAGELVLELRCRRLKRGAAARVRIAKPIVRHFRLRQGSGTLRIHLDKPPGKVEPYAHVSYGKATPCKSVGHKLRLRSRSFDLRINARCGRIARNATGHLYVGGLLAAGR